VGVHNTPVLAKISIRRNIDSVVSPAASSPQALRRLAPQAPPMEGQQDAVAEGANKLEVLHLCFGTFPNPTNFTILAAGGTICEPSGEIGNVSVDGHGHDFIIQRLKGSPRFDLGQLRGPVRRSQHYM
jgi:hypothetical protein